MRDLTFETMDMQKNAEQMDAVVGAAFERSNDSEDFMDSEDVVRNSWGWTVLVCF